MGVEVEEETVGVGVEVASEEEGEVVNMIQ